MAWGAVEVALLQAPARAYMVATDWVDLHVPMAVAAGEYGCDPWYFQAMLCAQHLMHLAELVQMALQQSAARQEEQNAVSAVR